MAGVWREGVAQTYYNPKWTCVSLGKKGTGPICAKHPPGRSGKLDLSPFSLPCGWGMLKEETQYRVTIAGSQRLPQGSGKFTDLPRAVGPRLFVDFVALSLACYEAAFLRSP